jgi:hypothetical protein
MERLVKQMETMVTYVFVHLDIWVLIVKHVSQNLKNTNLI